MKRISLSILVLMAFGLFTTASADEHTSLGSKTQTLLELQRSGTAASNTQRPMTSEMARRSYDRLLETYNQPISESFSADQESFVEGR